MYGYELFNKLGLVEFTLTEMPAAAQSSSDSNSHTIQPRELGGTHSATATTTTIMKGILDHLERLSGETKEQSIAEIEVLTNKKRKLDRDAWRDFDELVKQYECDSSREGLSEIRLTVAEIRIMEAATGLGQRAMKIADDIFQSAERETRCCQLTYS